jgi:hypothetical protein
MKLYFELLEVYPEDNRVEVLVLLNATKTVEDFHTVIKYYPLDQLNTILDCTEQYPAHQFGEMEIVRIDGRIRQTFKKADRPTEEMVELFDKPDYFADLDTSEFFKNSDEFGSANNHH